MTVLERRSISSARGPHKVARHRIDAYTERHVARCRALCSRRRRAPSACLHVVAVVIVVIVSDGAHALDELSNILDRDLAIGVDVHLDQQIDERLRVRPLGEVNLPRVRAGARATRSCKWRLRAALNGNIASRVAHGHGRERGAAAARWAVRRAAVARADAARAAHYRWPRGAPRARPYRRHRGRACGTPLRSSAPTNPSRPGAARASTSRASRGRLWSSTCSWLPDRARRWRRALPLARPSPPSRGRWASQSSCRSPPRDRQSALASASPPPQRRRRRRPGRLRAVTPSPPARSCPPHSWLPRL
mmetsp:Transcript_29811/g.77140  ORF Transcript_29811/g.77140 Transcript_29811/m.77140 type:complete len:305 (+) Transcript_29811:145-1059(+)